MCKRIHVSILTYKHVNINMYTPYPPFGFGTEGGNIWKRSKTNTWRISAHVYRVNQCVYMGVCICEHATSCVHAKWAHGTINKSTREHMSRTCVYKRTGDHWVIKWHMWSCDQRSCVSVCSCVRGHVWTYELVTLWSYEQVCGMNMWTSNIWTCRTGNIWKCRTSIILTCWTSNIWTCGHITNEHEDT